jgi:dipeptidyl aminopeptidase/acylaminoacyl peptidase
MIARAGLAVALTAASLLVAAPQAARATGDTVETRLVWSRFVDAGFSAARIVIAPPSGAPVRELTHSADGVFDIDPRLSPDGRTVAFERDFPDGTSRIALIGSDGRGERVLDLGCTDPCAAELTPTWTPDGRAILFTRVIGPFDRPNESAASAVLWRADLDRGGVRRVERFLAPGIDGAYEDYRATWAPAGYVVFVRIRDLDNASAVFRSDPDGLGLRRLTSWALGADLPAVSPARSGPTKDLVVFEMYGHGGPPDDTTSQAVTTVPATCRSEADCAARTVVLTGRHVRPEQNFNPDWSPDGRSIAFVKFTSSPTTSPTADIWTMRWDGAQPRPVSESPLFEYRPSWGVRPAGPSGWDRS